MRNFGINYLFNSKEPYFYNQYGEKNFNTNFYTSNDVDGDKTFKSKVIDEYAQKFKIDRDKISYTKFPTVVFEDNTYDLTCYEKNSILDREDVINKIENSDKLFIKYDELHYRFCPIYFNHHQN